MNESAHIVTAVDTDLGQIETLLLEMGGLVEAQIADGVQALITRDVEAGQRVRRKDKQVDAFESKIDELAIRFIAMRQPMAVDLRRVVTALKITSALERMGDYAKNMGKRVEVLAEAETIGGSLKAIERMSEMVREMVRDVLDAFIARDTAMAYEIRDRDEQVDQLHNTMFREMLTYMMEQPENITPCMHLLFITKNVERMGDHATGIAEQIIYLVDGSLPDDDRQKGDETSYYAGDKG
ncbi:MAG: phosphate signaling complex protein PhoU [Paracoccaceae bacterium]|nr:phosphate signaling complex protein PhoU [Paracoccaceae bacterium]MDG1368725.1 phosphate signaling complex protein PhoU [Paracoccaceae bacterium]